MNWLDKFTNSMSEVESPSRWFYWAGMAVLSGVVKKNVYWDKYTYRLYPNIYVLLISASSGLRKGIPMLKAKELASSTGMIRTIKGRSTIQALVSELSKQKTFKNGTILDKAQALILAPELDTLLVEDPDAMSILTDLQNTHEHEDSWENRTKSGGAEELKDPCITLLGASNEVLFEKIVSKTDMEGGFIGRCFIVYESKVQNLNSLMFAPQNVYPKEELESYLKEVSKLKGEFKVDRLTRMFYDSWYIKLATKEYKDRTGSLNRLCDQVLKAAMLISVASRLDLVVNEEIMNLAIAKTEENYVTGTRKIANSGKGNAPISPFVATFIKILLLSPDNKATREDILRKGFPDISQVEIDQVYNTLNKEQGQNIVTMDYTTNGYYYKLTNEFVSKMNEGL